MCILAGFLLVPSTGEFTPIIVDVAQQMGKCMDPVPMILAETLIGLGKVSQAPSEL